MNILQKPFGLVHWGNTSLQSTCSWKCLDIESFACSCCWPYKDIRLCNLACRGLWHCSVCVHGRGHPAVVTVLKCRNSVKSDLGHGSELECSPHMLQRGEGGFAGHSQLELKDLPCSEGSHRYRRKTAFQGRKGRDLLLEWVLKSTVLEAFTYMMWFNFQQGKYYSFLFRYRGETHGDEIICQWFKVPDLNPLLNGSKSSYFLLVVLPLTWTESAELVSDCAPVTHMTGKCLVWVLCYVEGNDCLLQWLTRYLWLLTDLLPTHFVAFLDLSLVCVICSVMSNSLQPCGL